MLLPPPRQPFAPYLVSQPRIEKGAREREEKERDKGGKKQGREGLLQSFSIPACRWGPVKLKSGRGGGEEGWRGGRNN